MDAKSIIARRGALELNDGDVVNLGIGLPTQVANYAPEAIEVTFQSENGFLGLGAITDIDSNLVNAGGQPCGMVPGMGGAMNLVVGAKKVIIALEHCAKNGAPKLLHECTYPLTAANKVSMVVTELAVFEFIDQQMVLREISPDITLDELRQKTEANFIVSDDLQPLKVY